MSELEHILSVKNEAGEGPVWNADEQALYWVDVLGHCFHRFYPATGKHEVFEVGLPVSALGFRESGGLVMVTWEGFAFWDPQTKEVQLFANPAAEQPGSRFNDAAVDRQGRFWAGTWGGMGSNDPTNCLYRLDPDGSIHTMETGITISNGIGWSPDNKTMYFTDSPPRVIYAYDFDPTTGAIENRRIFVQTPEEEGEPDGLTVDSEGFVWSARWGGWKVTRYDPTGKMEREIRLPVQYPTSCTFGGAQLNELYITSASTALSEEQQREQPLAGDLFGLRTDVRGLEEPNYLG